MIDSVHYMTVTPLQSTESEWWGGRGVLKRAEWVPKYQLTQGQGALQDPSTSTSHGLVRKCVHNMCTSVSKYLDYKFTACLFIILVKQVVEFFMTKTTLNLLLIQFYLYNTYDLNVLYV